jgi:uncharacterized membrane protein
MRHRGTVRGTFAMTAGFFSQNSIARDQVIGRARMKGNEMRGFLLGALAVAVVVLGYLYYEETRNDASITIEAPKIETPR